MNIESLKNRIEIKVTSDYPSIETSDFTRSSFEEFYNHFDNCKTNTNIVIPLVRCWNKNNQDISDFFERIVILKKNFPEIEGLIVAINYNKDNDNITENSIKEQLKKKEIDIPVLPLRINGYTWTSGLNVGVALLNEIANQKNIDKENIKLMGMSFDVEMETEEIKKMKELSEKNRFVVTIRKTAEEKLPFEVDKDNLWKKFKSILREQKENELLELCYSMRNTLSLIKLSDLVDFDGFNPLCDGKIRGDMFVEGGMEDIDFFLKIILNALDNNKLSTIRDFKRSINNGVVTYTDLAWKNIRETGRCLKISREVRDLKKFAEGMTKKIKIKDFKIYS